MQGKSIILSGMPGCGKTTVGRILSHKTGISFIDLDDYIEQKENKKITEIFKIYGEEYFRALETSSLLALNGDFILSLGGGVMMKDENIRILKEMGSIFYINTDIKVIFERIKNDTSRPLLNCENPFEKLKELYQKRKNSYELSDYTIDGSKDPYLVAGDIIKIYEENRS